MRAAIDVDTTTRTIEIRIADGPDLDITQSWQTRTREIQVDRALIKLVNGEPRSITVSGPQRLKNGQVSHNAFGHYGWKSSDLPGSPVWVRKLFAEAPEGVTEWTMEVP